MRRALAIVLAASLAGACSHHASQKKDGGADGTVDTGRADSGSRDDGDARAIPAGSDASDAGDVSDAGVAPALDATDGPTETRLVAWRLESPGTAPLVLGILDTQEKTRCRFVPDRTGQLRCLPPGPASLSSTGQFLDAGCTKMVYAIGTQDLAAIPAGQPVALPQPRSGCDPVRYEVGTLTAIAADTPVFQGAACASGDLFPQDGSSFVAAASVALERWAAGTPVDGPLVGGRLLVAQVQAADGARFDDHAVDTRYSKPCSLATKAGACTPAMLPAVSGYFGDDQCTGPLAREEVCDAALVASNATLPFRALGGKWLGAVFENKPAPCHAATPAFVAISTFFTVGPPLDGEPVMSVDWPQKGTGRLRLRELEGKTGPSVPVGNTLSWSTKVLVAPRYFDAVTGADCNPVWTPEGLVRCVPATVKTSYFPTALFADAACKTPGYLCYDADCANQPTMDIDTDRTTGVHARSIHATVSVPALFTISNGSCASALTNATFLFGAGQALSWDTFPALTEVNAR